MKQMVEVRADGHLMYDDSVAALLFEATKERE